jgi:hypothetical protein
MRVGKVADQGCTELVALIAVPEGDTDLEASKMV